MARVAFGILVIVVILALVTLGLGYLWHEGAYPLIYQFAVSGGLIAFAFYFFILSKGNTNSRIIWGLVFLVLSPISYLTSGHIFWDKPEGESTISEAISRSPLISKNEFLRFLVYASPQEGLGPGGHTIPVWAVFLVFLPLSLILRSVFKRRSGGTHMQYRDYVACVIGSLFIALLLYLKAYIDLQR